ncbi:MAG: putative sulfate exporter family transporter [Bacteroidota bacterium]
MTEQTKSSGLTEDWTAVILGFTIILFSLVVRVPGVLWQFVLVLSVVLLATVLQRKPIVSFLKMFPLVFMISFIAQMIAANKTIKGLGLEAVIFSLVFGLIIGNTFKLPDWFKKSLSTELFVKIGLVLLGTSVLFKDILQAGSLGLIQALVVVISVWYFAYWVCKKLKLDEELSMMLSSAVSICGVSAAIATAGAIKGDPKKLSYVISIVLITAIPMMIVMPYVAKYFGWSEEVTGAWLGGTIDTTGAVVASGTLVGEKALATSTIVKFSQNVLLGIAAFAISIYWSVNGGDGRKKEKPTAAVIWERFPKFVLGFIAASLLFSFFVPTETTKLVKDSLKSIQTLFFVLAFTSIGLETRFSDFSGSLGWKPFVAFLVAQGFNIVVTLIVAMILFGS